MCILVQDTETTLLPEDITAAANRACEKIQAMAEAVIAMAFNGETAAEICEGKRSAHTPRIGAEFAIDAFRSVVEEVLTGQVRRGGYANTESLALSWTACLDQNAAARRAAPLTDVRQVA